MNTLTKLSLAFLVCACSLGCQETSNKECKTDNIMEEKLN